MKNNQKSSRYLAMIILEKIETKGAYSNLLLKQTVEHTEIESNEVNLLTELVYGVMQRKKALDYQLSPFIKKPKKLQNWVRQLLRLSLYQFLYLDRIPDHAVINEAVSIAKIHGHKGVSGLVNGVLRTIQRKGVPNFEEIEDPAERLGVEYSLPEWMVTYFIQSMGFEKTEQLAKSFLNRANVSIRVNLDQISREEVMDQLKEEEYDVKASKLSPAGLISENGLPAKSSLFKSGKITFQDESSMLVAPALQVEPHHRVLDACAAPGGKTTHLASYVDKGSGGEITALDLHDHKVKLIEKSVKRQQVSDVVTTYALDARDVEEKFAEGKFDRILVDAPCSGLGLMQRKPDIRYTKSLEDIYNLQKVQLAILSKVSKVLKSGGQLVYSTCTITDEENNHLINRFLSENPAFERVSVYLENDVVKSSSDNSVTILPYQHNTDGFFICTLKKKEN